MAHMATPLYLCYISSTDITFASTPYPHMCSNSQYPAPGRCSLHISLPHTMALQRELLPARRRSITRNRLTLCLTLEWVAASEVIDTTPTIIRQVVQIFFWVIASGGAAVDTTHARQRLGCVGVKVCQQQPTLWALEGKNTKHSWIFFLLTHFAWSTNRASLKKKREKKMCTK